MELYPPFAYILPCIIASLIPTTLTQTAATPSPSMPSSSSSNGNINPGSPMIQSPGSNPNVNPINNPSPNAMYQQGYQATGYQPQDNYVPHATYPYAESFPNPGYDGYLVPAGPIGYSNNGGTQQVAYGPSGSTSLLPTAQQVLVAALRLFAKVGLFLLGGVALLIVGGIFTTAVCSLTPICTISFTGLRGTGLDQETVRSLMTPDKIATAANFVHDAIGKYQRLQRSIAEN